MNTLIDQNTGDMEADVPPEFRADYNDDHLINYSQNMRRKLIAEVMSDPLALKDPDARKEIAVYLDSVSTTAIQNKRIQAKETEEANMRDVALLLAKVSMQANTGANPFKSAGGGAPPPGLDMRVLEQITIPEGELKQGHVNQTKQEFLDRMEQ